MHCENPLAWALEFVALLPVIYWIKITTAHKEFMEDLLLMTPT